MRKLQSQLVGVTYEDLMKLRNMGAKTAEEVLTITAQYPEAMGGRVSGSVTNATDYLVNNDSESTSTKNKKAKSLGIPIITEVEFVRKFGK